MIDLNKHGAYPYEICLDVHPIERGWFPYMISDACCLHSMMFLVHAFVDGSLLSHLASFHYAQTLRLLQAQLNRFDEISDATIMVVISLASAAEAVEDFKALENHMSGLEKMLEVRGGVRVLNTNNNIQVKVCRYDFRLPAIPNADSIHLVQI